LFLYLNANKEGIVLDISSDRGRQTLEKLIGQADVLLENFEPGHMARLGVGYEEVAPLNPRLVYTSVSPFGQTGPRAHYRAPDMVRQAYAAWMIQGGDPGREPLRSGGDISYYITGASAAVATLVGVNHVAQSGEGQHIDVSSLEAFITCAGEEIYRASEGAMTWGRHGHHGLPIGIFPAKDGLIGINILLQANWESFCQWAGMEDLLANERYADRAKLIRYPERGEELAERVSAWTIQHERMWLLEEGQKRRIAMALVPSMADVVNLPQHLAREFLQTVKHPAGSYIQPGAPFKMAASPWSIRKPAPTLGEDNDAIVSDR
jgi:crotonobetainyl-CoA:carnitine CoA-transferase CaiB-like acyl-CoA transferase